MGKMSSIQTRIPGRIFGLFILVGISMVLIAVLIEISGLVLANPQPPPVSNEVLPSLHNLGMPAFHPTESASASARLPVFAAQNSPADSQINGAGASTAPSSLPVQENQKTLTVQQIVDILTYLLNINHSN